MIENGVYAGKPLRDYLKEHPDHFSDQAQADTEVDLAADSAALAISEISEIYSEASLVADLAAVALLREETRPPAARMFLYVSLLPLKRRRLASRRI